jgi:hypothetical protein
LYFNVACTIFVYQHSNVAPAKQQIEQQKKNNKKKAKKDSLESWRNTNRKSVACLFWC